MAIKVFHRDEPKQMMPFVAKDARLIVWPGVGAYTAPLNYVNMQPGEENIPHVHEDSEDTLFVLEGLGSIEDVTNGKTHRFGAGQVVFVPPGVEHCVRGDRGVPVVSVGGPAPADLDVFKRLGIPVDLDDEPTSSLEAR